ncbi:hypothetical protein Dvina_15330 [Dactylosporangium vinaceum]|uniref:FtsX-like permease family protein n=1 Tax=Dactylosporangium vinaceum TaxID=53362 RepID=A0ABV5M1U6_9ACTN|nr:hypothetical protein [Dactylosporangium vinaceum]UAB99324.1 hypothetical protein Dvina_15330 [Dactylosporangium vinaceum]
MIALILGMLRSRLGRALTVALLTALATVAAVAAPVYVARTDRQIVDTAVAQATTKERNIQVSGGVDAGSDGRIPATFERLGSGWVDAPGYTSVFRAQFAAQSEATPIVDADQLSRVVFRESLCEHVVVVAGRCLMGTGDAVLSVGAGDRLKVKPGDAVGLTGSVFDAISNRYLAAGPPTPITVVGIVRARDGTEPYWGSGGALTDADGPAYYVDRRTLATFSRGSELQTYDAYPQPGAISVEHLDALRAWVEDSGRRNNSGARLTTDLGALLDRIDERRADVRATVPFAVAPVLVLAWAVIILAVAAATRARRFEHGIIALRGVSRPNRWWLATGETLLPMLLGAVAGFTAVGGWTTPGAPLYAAVAVVGAVLAGLVVGVRTVSGPVAALLRRVDVRSGRWGARIAVFAAVAAAAATFQLRGGSGGVAGVAPALVLLAIALLTAVVAPLLAARLGASALRRGRLTGALAGLSLARRPSAARLLAVLVVALSSLAFAAAAVTQADQRRADQAQQAMGASTVLSVGATTRHALLEAVHAADPDGRYAMAVVPIPGGLAVDSPRLAVAGNDGWAAPLRPVAPADSATVTGTTLDLDITVTLLDRTDDAFAAVVAPLNGRPNATVEFGAVKAGRHTYSAAMPCAGGCRLIQLAFRLAPYAGPALELTLHNAPTTTWQSPPGATVTVQGQDVAMKLPPGPDAGTGVLRPGSGPAVLPVVSTGPLPPTGLLTVFDRQRQLPAKVVATVPRLPRLGTDGLLVDLESADRLSIDSAATGAEVWLAADTPQPVLDAIAAHGVTIDARRTVADARAALAGEGSALGLRFYLVAGVLAVVLAAAALLSGTVEGASNDLRTLRGQGLAARRARLVEPLAAVLLVLFAGVVAVPATVAAWAAAAPPDLRGVPALGPPLAALGAGLVLLVVVAVLTATTTRAQARVSRKR